MSGDKTPDRQRIGSDLLLPAAGVAYAIYYVYSVWDFPAEARRSGLFLAGLFIVLSAMLFLRTAIRAARGQVEWEFDTLLGPREGRWQRFGFLLLIFAYLMVVQSLGFTVTTFLFLLIGSLLAGIPSLKQALVFAASAALIGYLFFIELLGTRFPRGPFEALVAQAVALWN